MDPNPNLCPRRTAESFRRYRDQGITPGDFGVACLANDLSASFIRADMENREALGHIVAWLQNEMPSSMWGSLQAVRAHLASFHVDRETEERETERDPEPPRLYERGELAPADCRTEHDRTL